ncbi:hypothetical protein BBP00_00000404 [Phytophthora kernoviae]|uniref:USP domain-containing protein n=1 Tax=Phytophthora kernoviae TaxID=325452 RepID=A0A3F2S393_9STRA|nr:hypothetical protein BBP00_00000404 [Phytophthora kernoviae]
MDIHTPEGYDRLNTDLNKDRTELMVKVAFSTDPKPSIQGFERVELDLNVGGGATPGGKKQVYLFYRREPDGSPITDLQVIYGNEAIPDGFKQIQVDINQGDGSKVFLCYRCDMPITDLKIVNSGIPGYRMVDHLLNMSHEDAVKQYLALKVGGHDPCLTDLKLVEGIDVPKYQEEGWQSIGSPLSFTPLPEPSLNEEPFVPAQLMVRRGHGNPIFAIDVFRAPRQVPKYNDYETTPAGHSANLNDGTSGVPVFICYRHSGGVDDAVGRSDGATPKILMDLALMWTSGAQPDSLPTGFTKIHHTPLGMEANLNQGTSGVAIHICYSKFEAKDIVQPIENMINGEYEITSAPLPAFGRFLSLSVVEELEEARTVEGNFGTVLHAQLSGAMNGLLFTSKHQQANDKKCRKIVGAWRVESPMGGLGVSSMTDFLPSSYPFELTLNEPGTEMDGWWSAAEGTSSSPSKPGLSVVTSAGNGAAPSNAAAPGATAVSVGGKWKLVKDSYVHIAFKKDYSTEWQDGQLVFSERVWQHDIASMLSRFVATRTLGGDNALSCSACQRKTESRTHTVIFDPPEHLIITLKRMYYDWGQQKARKCLHDVRFPALLTLPSLTADEELAVYESTNVDVARTKQRNRSRHYGLYGVLVHSGLTANSGHYYSFCRESDESTRQLHLEDSPLSPWIKFNDTKKLSYEPPSADTDTDQGEGVTADGGSDDEEAMLLAKAMALSMSAAKQQRQVEDEESKGESEIETNTNVESETTSVLSTNWATKALLKKVEEENQIFLRESLTATSSALHADDLHTLLVLRHSLPLHVRSLLDEIC